MLRSSVPAATPELGQIVRDMLAEDAEYDRHENRSMHREHLVRSVLLQMRKPVQGTILAFSRNVSGHGIGLITQEPIPDRSEAVLVIEGIKRPDVAVISQCRWCLAYGSNWHFSGWQFQLVKRQTS
ncbi:hypothetical protein [Planctomycetes bacterium K23_9]|uniref:PilZ domain-containing protein n=1 Tax=Stieleria marina TaxID=1930275 RepID=A0A517NZ42_9BACT|nr:hypothetical protein K239x_43830 [Planctomycetes bacterium K23_9]